MTEGGDEAAVTGLATALAGQGQEQSREIPSRSRVEEGKASSATHLEEATARRRRRSSSSTTSSSGSKTSGTEPGDNKSMESNRSSSKMAVTRRKSKGHEPNRPEDQTSATTTTTSPAEDVDGDGRRQSLPQELALPTTTTVGHGKSTEQHRRGIPPRGLASGVDDNPVTTATKTTRKVSDAKTRRSSSKKQDAANPSSSPASSLLTGKPTKGCPEESSPPSTHAPEELPTSSLKRRKIRRSSRTASADGASEGAGTTKTDAGLPSFCANATSQISHCAGGPAVQPGPATLTAPSQDSTVVRKTTKQARKANLNGERDRESTATQVTHRVVPGSDQNTPRLEAQESQASTSYLPAPGDDGESGTPNKDMELQEAHECPLNHHGHNSLEDPVTVRKRRVERKAANHPPKRGEKGSPQERHEQDRAKKMSEEVNRERRRSGEVTSLPRKQPSYSDESLGLEEDRKNAVAAESPAISVEVIDKGATKDLVLTSAADASWQKPGSSDQLERAAISSNGVSRRSHANTSLPREQEEPHARDPLLADPEEEKRNRCSRNKLSAAASTREENRLKQPVESHSMEPRENANGLHVDRGFALHAPPPRVREVREPALEQVNTQASVGMAPSFSVQSDTVKHVSTPHKLTTTPGVISRPLDIDHFEDQPSLSPTSSDECSFADALVPERTARYVQQQASFHADVSAEFLSQTSPIGREAGKTWSRTAAGRVSTFHEELTPAGTADPKIRVATSSFGRTGGRETESHARGRRSLESVDRRWEDEAPPSTCQENPTSGKGLAEPRGGDCRSGEDVPVEGLVHFRSEVSRELFGGDQPALFFLRPNESLAVTRIEGVGRLLLTLRGEPSADKVTVDSAVVYDSAAHFGHASIQTDHRFPYVAGHRYEFRVESAQGVELAGRGEDAAASDGSTTAKGPGLKVVFSVMSTYTEGERLNKADAERMFLPAFEPLPVNSMPNTPNTTTLDAASHLSSSTGVAAGRNAPHLYLPLEKRPTAKETEASTVTPMPEMLVPAAAPRSVATIPPNAVVSGPGLTNDLGGQGGESHPNAESDERYRYPWTGIATAAAATVPLRSASGIEATHIGTRHNEGARYDSFLRPEAGGSSRIGERIGREQGDSEGLPHATRAPNPYALPRTQNIDRPHDVNIGPTRGEREGWQRGDNSEEQLAWNPAWEHAASSQTSPSLPYIRQRAEMSPRSALGQQNLQKNRAQLAGAIGFHGHLPYAPEPTSTDRHVGGNGEAPPYSHRLAPEVSSTYDDRPSHMQHNATPPYRRRGFDEGRRSIYSPLHGGGGGSQGRGNQEGEWDQRAGRNSIPDRGSSDSRFAWRGDGRASEWGNHTVERRRSEGGDYWTLRERPDVRRDAALHASAGDDRQWVGGNNEETRVYHHHHRRALSLSDRDDSRGDGLPPSGKSRWEAGVPSGPHHATKETGEGCTRGRGATEKASVVKRVYPDALTRDRALRRGSIRDRREGDVERHQGESGERRVSQDGRHANQEPLAHRKQREKGGNGVTQPGFGNAPGRIPPRWVKF